MASHLNQAAAIQTYFLELLVCGLLNEALDRITPFVYRIPALIC
jgi:hypothetical protein